MKNCEIYGLLWNKNPQFTGQFVACDSESRITVWDINNKKNEPV